MMVVTMHPPSQVRGVIADKPMNDIHRRRVAMHNGYRMLLLAIVALVPAVVAAQNYSGASACQACHSNAMIGGEQYTQWLTTRHAVAYDSVTVIQANASCLPCHVTGWDTTQANGGFDDFYLAQPPDQAGITKMKNVQWFYICMAVDLCLVTVPDSKRL